MADSLIFNFGFHSFFIYTNNSEGVRSEMCSIYVLSKELKMKLSYLPSHILTRQSLPPVTNLLTGGCAAGLFGPVAAAVDPPGTIEGAQLTELTPIGCAWKM